MGRTALWANKKSAGGNAGNSLFFQRKGINSAHADAFFNPVQTKLSVGHQNDTYEKQADAVAETVVQGGRVAPQSYLSVTSGGLSTPRSNNIHRKSFFGGEEIQAKSFFGCEQENPLQAKSRNEEYSNAGSDFENQLSSCKGDGQALTPAIQGKMETSMGATFSQVRVHTGSNAAQLSNQANARVFTHGNDIYFNQGEYQPETSKGERLLAHELTHTVQQGASGTSGTTQVQRKSNVIQASILDSIGSFFSSIRTRVVNFVQSIPGFFLFTVLLGRNPLTDASVDRNGMNFIKGFLLLLPNGQQRYNTLLQEGALDRSAAWIDAQMAEIAIIREMVSSAFSRAVDSISASDVFDVGGALRRIRGYFTTVINRAISFASRLVTTVLNFLKDAILNSLVQFVRDRTRAYPLLRTLLGHDPITGEEVPRTMENIVHGFLMLTESGEAYYTRMMESGALPRALAWMREQIATLPTLEEVVNAFLTVWRELSFEDLFQPVAAFTRIYNTLSNPVGSILAFVGNVAWQILLFIKDAMLSWLQSQADSIPGYHLLTVLLGRDVFTNEIVRRTTANIIRGFMGLIPGGEAQYQQMLASGVIPRLANRIDSAIARLGITWDFIRNLFISIWQSMRITDLIVPIMAFTRIIARFREPLGRIIAFVRVMVLTIVEVILRMMNFPVDLIGQIMQNAMTAYQDIKRDPMGFIKNLLRSVKQGFTQFFNNIGTHLIQGVNGWLFGQLESAGIQPPADLSLRSILGMMMQIMGITVDNILHRLGERIGHDKVERVRSALNTLTGIWTFIRDVIERGPVAIWERIQNQLSNLWNVVLEGIRNWIVTQIITAVTTKLLSMLDPTGIMAVVNSFIAFYRAVQSFIEQLTRILQVINSFVMGVGEIARGSIVSAANFLENALARALPVAIGFLANQVGLRNLGSRIAEMAERGRETVNQGIDWLIDKAISTGTAIFNLARRGANAVISALTPWRNAEKRFTDDSGESHRIYIDQSAGRPSLKVASQPKSIPEFLDYWQGRPNISNDKRAKINEARTHYNSHVLPLINQIKASEDNNEPESNRIGLLQQLLTQNTELSVKLKAVIGSGTSLANVRERYALEGMVGRYNAMAGGRGDQITPDHQPQNSAIIYASNKACFDETTRMRTHAASRSARGFTINLHHRRHVAGRTYGRSPASSFTSAVDRIAGSNDDYQTQRHLIVEELKTELRLDVERMNEVVGRPLTDRAWEDIRSNTLGLSEPDQETFKNEIKNRVLQGEREIAQQPMDNLKD